MESHAVIVHQWCIYGSIACAAIFNTYGEKKPIIPACLHRKKKTHLITRCAKFWITFLIMSGIASVPYQFRVLAMKCIFTHVCHWNTNWWDYLWLRYSVSLTTSLSNMYRIAFHGVLLHPITEKDHERSVLPRLRIFKLKSKEGVVERVSALFLSLFMPKNRNSPSSANQGLSTSEPRHGNAVYTLRVHPPTTPITPFLLTQNLSPKDIAGSDITKLKVSRGHIQGRKGSKLRHTQILEVECEWVVTHSQLCKIPYKVIPLVAAMYHVLWFASPLSAKSLL